MNSSRARVREPTAARSELWRAVIPFFVRQRSPTRTNAIALVGMLTSRSIVAVTRSMIQMYVGARWCAGRKLQTAQKAGNVVHFRNVFEGFCVVVLCRC
jgi:hypothetical protein